MPVVTGLLPLIIVLIHLSDAYLRYLAFKNRLSTAKRRLLWLSLTAWGALHLFLYAQFFHSEGLGAFSYKTALILGWIPYLLIFMCMVRQAVWQHIFVFGMSALWSFAQHNWSSIFLLDILGIHSENLLPTHASLYLLLFLVLLPWERRFFGSLLITPHFFEQRPLNYYIALLPLAVLVGPLLLIADNNLVHSFNERISRLLLPVIFFFIYRYILIVTDQFYNELRLKRNASELKLQLTFLEDHQRLLLQNQKNLTVLKHDLRHTYRILYSLLQAGEIDKALDHIQEREASLANTPLRLFSESPLINAALSVSLARAAELNIRVQQKINLPAGVLAEENDLAVLLSNLLENALNASQSQPPQEREITISLQHSGKQCVLEIANRYNAPLKFDKNGLPKTNRDGHGLGMVSLLGFADKYNAYVDFSQSDGWVKVCMYWEII